MCNVSINELYIDTIIKNEKIRNQKMIDVYNCILEMLPKGKLVVRELKGNKYSYLRYRDGSKAIMKYTCNYSKYDDLVLMINEREHIKNVLEMLKKEQNKIIKMEQIK